MANKAEIFKGADDQWYFRILAANGEPVAQSEGYTEKKSAKDTIEAIFPSVQIVEINEA